MAGIKDQRALEAYITVRHTGETAQTLAAVVVVAMNALLKPKSR